MARCLNCIHKNVCNSCRMEVEHLSGDCTDYLSADVVQKSEVARGIFEEIEELLREWFDFFRQGDDIRESCAIMAALSQVTELKKKYTEEK